MLCGNHGTLKHHKKQNEENLDNEVHTKFEGKHKAFFKTTQ